MRNTNEHHHHHHIIIINDHHSHCTQLLTMRNSLFLLFQFPSLSSAFAMTWSNTWDDILAGGSPRWIVDDPAHKETALNHILSHCGDITDDKLNIFCPLAGDDKFVHYAWSQGHTVTSIDLVPAAVAAMRKHFGEDNESWCKEEQDNKMVVWKHNSGRVTLYEGDAFTELPELKNRFDCVYDKDSFGALDKHMRQVFCERLSDYTKPSGIIYTEVKNKPEGPGREQGPPFHVEEEDLMEATSFGPSFEYMKCLGEVYPLKMPPGFKQMGHVLKRLPK